VAGICGRGNELPNSIKAGIFLSIISRKTLLQGFDQKYVIKVGSERRL
jgi:hypothetical protein